jgi:membrane protease YdiL (CAAX protease family)
MPEKNDSKNIRKYFLLSYLLFWLLLALTGYLISLEVPVMIQNIMKNISAAAPTFAILILFRQLYPGVTFKKYMQSHFLRKTKPLIFVKSFVLQLLIMLAAIAAFFLINNKPLNTVTLISISSILPVFILVLTSGSLGEELGWRGYALNTLQKKHTPLKAGLIVGVLWGFWHLPLIIISGYSGLELIYYLIAFIVGVVSVSIVITFYYNKSKNMLIAMWLHFWFNFLLQLVIIDLLHFIIYVSIGYLIAAIGIVLLNKKAFLTKEETFVFDGHELFKKTV